MSDLSLPYSQRDPADVLATVKQQLKEITDGRWTDFTENDLGYQLIKALVAINDFNAFFVDQQAAESFISTALLRESVIRRAKELNYTPRRATPSSVTVQLQNPSFGSQVSIPANSVWSIRGISFTCLTPIVVSPGQTTQTLHLVQGSPFTQTVTGTGLPWQSISVPRNIASMTLKVNGTTWVALDSFIGAEDSPESYKLYEDINGQTILFGDNNVSYAPTDGSTISITGVLTNGASGNIELSSLNVLPLSVIRDSSNNDITGSFSGTTTTAALGGTDLESINSIRTNAPKFYGTQGRAVTEADYEAIVRTVPGVTDVKVTGGEKIKRYGEVLIVAYGETPYEVNQDFIDLVKSYLPSMVAIKPVVVAPDPIDVSMSLTVGILDSSFSDAAAAQNLTNAAITDLFDGAKIGGSIYESDVLAAVDTISGVRYATTTHTLKSYSIANAGVLRFPITKNADVSAITIKDHNGATLFSGSGTSLVNADNRVEYTQTGLPDQVCTMTFASNTDDMVADYQQVLVLHDLTINTVFV